MEDKPSNLIQVILAIVTTCLACLAFLGVSSIFDLPLLNRNSNREVSQPTVIPTKVEENSSSVTDNSIEIQNTLKQAVTIKIDGLDRGIVDSESVKVFVLDSYPANVEWTVKKYISNGIEIGDNMTETFPNVFAGEKIEIDNDVNGQFYFYPIITNNTGSRCRVSINDGYESIENDTGGFIQNGKQDIVAGYFLLYTNSNVTLICDDNRIHFAGIRDEIGDSFVDSVDFDTGIFRIEFDYP